MRNTLVIRKVSLVCVVALGVAILLAMAAPRTETTYVDLFNPLGVPNPLVPNAVGQILDPGKIFCPGHTITTNPAQPCPEGSRMVVRGVRALSRVESEDPTMAGWMSVELNGNTNANFAGPVWGKLSIQLDAGGAWEGTWNSIREFVPSNPPVWTADLRVVLHGLDGEIDGMQAKCTEMITALTPMPILYKGIASCQLLRPGEK